MKGEEFELLSDATDFNRERRGFASIFSELNPGDGMARARSDSVGPARLAAAASRTPRAAVPVAEPC